MTFVPGDPIASGRPYPISAVADRAPSEMSEFVGETVFTLQLGEDVRRVCGVGRTDGDGVRFHEKDVEHTTKDVRVWEIRRSGDRFVAASAATF
jgi:hypothetical protein